MNNINRRNFLKKTTLASLSLGLMGASSITYGRQNTGKKVGMIGLDTGHSVAFTKALNDSKVGERFNGYEVVAAYPKGTENITEWKKRIPEFTEEVKKQGVKIVDSIEELLKYVDVVLLTTIDGNKHLEQALPVLKAGKPMFIDKPFAGSLSDAYAIVEAAKKYDTPIFSSSSLRYFEGAEEIAQGKAGKVLGVNAHSPATIEKHHPDLFWYGIHGVEILFTLMGTGCKSVKRTYTEGTDLVVGIWEDDRIGCFRGIREGKRGYGGVVYGENSIEVLDNFQGYEPLLEKVAEFFSTGVSPVPIEETLEIFAFMQAAEASKERGGVSVSLEAVVDNAK